MMERHSTHKNSSSILLLAAIHKVLQKGMIGLPSKILWKGCR
uniref:Uncharacterized protein n=1 Tax=Arundo donax TaxID=35708 RepID=A0A0A9G585_ARUDO